MPRARSQRQRQQAYHPYLPAPLHQQQQQAAEEPLYLNGMGAAAGISAEQWAEHAKHLMREGYVVIPVLTREEGAHFKPGFLEAFRSAPEVVGDDPVLRYQRTPRNQPNRRVDAVNGAGTLGGFGGYALPSANHWPLTRRLRARINRATEPLWQQLGSMLVQQANETHGRPYEATIQQLFDRWVVRWPGATPMAESIHRDRNPSEVHWPDMTSEWGATKHSYPTPTHFGHVFGGWLGDEDRVFTAAPRSHEYPVIGEQQSNDEGRADWGFSLLSKGEASTWRSELREIVVPANHLVLFYQSLVHEVTPTKACWEPFGAWLHCAFNVNVQRAGSLPQEAFGNGYADYIMEGRALSMLPSGQTPPLFSSNHYQYSELLTAFADNLDPRLRQERETARTGRAYRAPPRHVVFAPWIQSAVPDYTPGERAEMRPHVVKPQQ